MKAFKIHLICVLFVLSLLLFLSSCSNVSDKKLKVTEDRINTLESKGVPDTMLTVPRVLMAQIKACKMSGNMRMCNKYNDSMNLLVDNVETWLGAKMEENRPFIDSLHKELTTQKEKLTGLHIKAVDSIFVIIDSFISQNWLLQARHKLVELNTLFPIFLENEAKAKKFRPKIIGVWKSVETPMDKSLNAVWKRIFNFQKDGTVKTRESKKGKSQVNLIEDWEFVSSGTWDLIGDTIFIKIDKEKCTRQIYTSLIVKNGKEEWEKNVKPTYDTTFTEKTKDSFMTYDYLSHSLDKKRR